MCLRGGVKLVDGGYSFQDGLALSDAFRDVVGSQPDFTGDICGVADCTAEMEIAWESDRETRYYSNGEKNDSGTVYSDGKVVSSKFGDEDYSSKTMNALLFVNWE